MAGVLLGRWVGFGVLLRLPGSAGPGGSLAGRAVDGSEGQGCSDPGHSVVARSRGRGLGPQAPRLSGFGSQPGFLLAV